MRRGEENRDWLLELPGYGGTWVVGCCLGHETKMLNVCIPRKLYLGGIPKKKLR